MKIITNEMILLLLLVIITGFIIFNKPLENLYIKHFVKNKNNLANENSSEKESQDELSKNTCGSKDSGVCIYNSNGVNKRILPVLDPLFNLREICKQIILLEDHLSHKGKRCYDCISKHFLYLEGLSEEAITLDVDRKYLDKLENLPDEFRSLQKEFLNKVDPLIISQSLRKIRKKYMEDSFKFSSKC
jgi:uncharacterized protein YxeA